MTGVAKALSHKAFATSNVLALCLIDFSLKNRWVHSGLNAILKKKASLNIQQILSSGRAWGAKEQKRIR
jgi:hypothetical protein